MTYKYFIGLDVGKDNFETATFGSSTTQSFSNDKHGFRTFCEAYAEQLSQAFVVVEATGGYESALIAGLLSSKVSVHRATPLQANNGYCSGCSSCPKSSLFLLRRPSGRLAMTTVAVINSR